MYNHNNPNTGLSCQGVTFNGGNDDGSGLCSQLSLILSVDVADEEGLSQDSALLIYNSAGVQLATPEPQPTLPPAPTLPPPPESTVFITSSVTITSCGPEVTNCPANSLSTSTVSLTSASSPTVFSISVSIAGGKTPASSLGLSSTTTTQSSSLAIITLSTATGTNGQVSYTELVPTTQYRIPQLVICTEPPPSPCFTSTGATETVVGYRTEVFCSPSPCTASFATGALASSEATDICIANF